MKGTVFGVLMVMLLSVAAPAVAYVGPGAGLSMLGALWGLLVAVLAALSFIIAWPVRRYLRRKRAQPAGTQTAAEEAATQSAHDERARDPSADSEGRL
ncbi:MAG: hypothetical protein WD382_08095 [Halofilum sp. (in: g-proteobacteria)]